MATGFSRSLKALQDGEYNFCCTPCADDKFNTEASFYCRNCSKLFCDTCVTHHDKIHKSHQIFGRKEVTKWGKIKLETYALLCEEHPDKEEEMYCTDHDITCCPTCINIYHRACKDRRVSEVAKGIQKTPEFQSCLTNAASTQTRLRQKRDKRVKNTKLLQKTRHELMSTFKDIRNSFNQFMDNVERESTTEIDRLWSILNTKVQSDADTCSDFDKEIQKFLDDIKKFGKQCDEFVFQCFKRCMRKLSSAEKFMSSMKDEDYQLKFIPDVSIKQFQSTLQTFGKFEVTPMNFLPDHVYTVDKIQKHNIPTTGITGMCQLSQGHVAAVDNNKVMLLSSSQYSVIDELDLSFTPSDVCTTTGTDLVITLSATNLSKLEEYMYLFYMANSHFKLQLLNAADGHLIKTHRFRSTGKCFGIACHNGQLYVSSESNLYKCSLSGWQLEQLERIYQDRTEQEKSVYRFAVSDDGNKIYIANFAQNCLVTIDSSGKELSVLKDPELQRPTGVCVADNGSVFVCGRDSHTIIQVDREGKRKIATLAKHSDGIHIPLSLCYDKILKQLLLGQEGSDNLLVLKLK